MFEDDDDIDFDDENFLNEVFGVAESSSTIRGQEGTSRKESDQNLFNSSKENKNSSENVSLKNRTETHQVRNSENDTSIDEVNFFENDFTDDELRNSENNKPSKDVVNFFENDFTDDQRSCENDQQNRDQRNFFEDDFTDDFDECFSEQTITNLEQTILDKKDCARSNDIKVPECVESTTKGKNSLVKECRLDKCESPEEQYQDEKNQSSVSWKRRRCSSFEEENLHTVKRHGSESGNQGTAVQAGESSEEKCSRGMLLSSSSHNKNSFKSSKVQVIGKNTSPQGQHVQQRRFPGPAGLLPKLAGRKDGNETQTVIRERASPSVSSENLICSQSSANDFYQGAWRQMVEDLDFNESNPKCPLSVFNIRWVMKRAALRGQAALRKVPFMAVLVKSVDLTHTHAAAVFRDKTGEMNGTIANQVLEEHLGNIQAGDLLVLRNVTLLSPLGIRKCIRGSDLHKNHYLNITANAVVMIYHRNESGGFRATSLSKLNLQEVLQEAATPTSSSGRRSVIEEEEEEEAVIQDYEGVHEQTGLFSNFYNKSNNFHSSGNSNFYNSGSSSYYNAPYRRENNNRMMSPNLPVRNQGSVMQPVRPQRLPHSNVNIYQSPPQGHMRPSGFVRNSAPVATPYISPVMSMTSSVNKSVTPSNATSECSGNNSSSTGSGKGKFVFQPKVASTGVQQKSILNDTNPEIDQLLDGIDEDSLFGDF